jgi:hypothetical protein
MKRPAKRTTAKNIPPHQTGLAWYRGMVGVAIGLVALVFCFQATTISAPLLANYYLGTLPQDEATINVLARNDVLVLSSEQGVIRKDVIQKIKQKNPKIVLLAYVISKSYDQNWHNYPANTVYNDFKVDDSCWLRDSRGTILSDWPGQQSLNMKEQCTDYLIQYTKDHILSQGLWDGIFWDVVNGNVSYTNHGDIDLNGDGMQDKASDADAEWLRRTNYLLSQSRKQLPVKYFVINGTSIPGVQPYVNGRMFENYPTPWEANGSWGGLMTTLAANQKANVAPQLYIFNSNTNNTGNRNDFRNMRFGLTSSLLTNNTYFAFDYGTNDHSQTWEYDEYNVKLGDPIAPPVSRNNEPAFKETDVWKREYSNGIALVNPTGQSQTVELGAEYEKIIGTQDKKVNDGAITDRVTLGAKDGIVMMKTLEGISSIKNTTFKNGSFLRFFDLKGNRARNGFFAFDKSYQGSATIYQGDLDGDGGEEKVVATGAKLEIFNSNGDRWFNDYPYGGNFKGTIQIAVGKFFGSSTNQIVVAPSKGGKVLVYDYHGELQKSDFYPLGKKYQNGFTVAVGSPTPKDAGELIVGVGKGSPTELLVYSSSYDKITKRFFPYDKKFTGGVTVAVGDINNDGLNEIVTLPMKGTPTARVYTAAGKKLSEFRIPSLFGSQPVDITIVDINFDGKSEIAVMNGQ